MKSVNRMGARPAALPLSADDLVEFHAARLLLLLHLCGIAGRIDGLTKMAKLDFFARYPDFFEAALVDEETERRLQQPDFRLRPQDWKCGERVWIIDVVTPAAQASALIDKLKAELLEAQEVRVRRSALPEAGAPKVAEQAISDL